MKIIRTNSNDERFIVLTYAFDKELELEYGNRQFEYGKYNKFGLPIPVLILSIDENLVGCAAFKQTDDRETVEIKRMYIISEYRRMGYGVKILQHLEQWIISMGYKNAILETANRQFAAIQFYKSQNYLEIEYFAPYNEHSNSICFRKNLLKS